MEELSCSDIYISTNGFNSLIVKLLLDTRVSVKNTPRQTERKEVIEAIYIELKNVPGFLYSWLQVIRLFLFGWFCTKIVKRGCLSTSKG